MTQVKQDKTADKGSAPRTARQAEQSGKSQQQQFGDETQGSIQQGGMGGAIVQFNDWASI